MGCNSSKASLPRASAKTEPAERTLLVAGQRTNDTEAVKETPECSQGEGKPLRRGFQGRWSAGVISGVLLTWADGRVSQIRIDDAAGTAEVCLDGTDFTGELRDDDRIYWNDGDIWSRHDACAAFHEYEGWVDHGPSLLIQTMTVESAKCVASTMPSCVGFTFEGEPTDGPVKVFFKSQWQIGGTGSTSYKLVEVRCAVGDDVMAVFAPNGKRYAAKIAAISDDNTITVNWTDGCKTHRDLPPTKVFKDGMPSFSQKDEEAAPASTSAASERLSHVEAASEDGDEGHAPGGDVAALDRSPGRTRTPTTSGGARAVSTASLERAHQEIPVQNTQMAPTSLSNSSGGREDGRIAGMPNRQKRKDKCCCC